MSAAKGFEGCPETHCLHKCYTPGIVINDKFMAQAPYLESGAEHIKAPVHCIPHSIKAFLMNVCPTEGLQQ